MSGAKAFKRRLRGAIIGSVVPMTARLFGALGWRRAQRLGTSLGTLAWRLAGGERRRTLAHLEIAFPELDAAGRAQLGRACFRHLGAMAGETFHLMRHGRAGLEGRLEIVGSEHLEAALAAPEPVVLLMAHCGNWELCGAALGILGVDTWAIVREMQSPEAEELVAGYRAHLGGIRSIPRGSTAASRALLSVLRQPRAALALLADQDFESDGVMVPFFGRPAFTPVGPARLALRRHCRMVPVFDHRLPDGRHQVEILPCLDLPGDETAATAALTAVIEAQIRRFPEQWVWMHRRWRRQAPERGLDRGARYAVVGEDRTNHPDRT